MSEVNNNPNVRRNRYLRIALSLALLGLMALLVTVPLEWKNQAILGAILLTVGVVIDRRYGGHQTTVVLMLMSVFCTARYFWWRVSETGSYLIVNGSQTHPLDLFFALLLLGAESYAVLILFLGYFQSFRPLRRRPVPLPRDVEQWPTVDLFVPTFGEPVDVIRATVLAALNIDWPKDRLKVFVLDDGKRSEVHELAEMCGAQYIARLDNQNAKAGNINHALARTSAEYVAVFDSDHIPTRSFLQVTMGWFLKDSRLAMVQTPHHFYSPDPFERNLGTFRRVPNESELFYGIVQDGNDFWNSAFFCGSCAVLRRSALEEVGGIATETVTEDSHTALRLQKLGWHTAYLNIPQAAGLATANVPDHITQRIRWARGMIQVLRIENPLFARGLKLPQRLCYFNSVIHFLHAAPRLIFLTAPLVYLLLGRTNLYGYVWAVLAYAIPHILMTTVINSRVQGGHRHSFWNEVFETILAPYILLPTWLALLNPRWGRFNVTPKRGLVDRSYFNLRIAIPLLILFLLNFAGFVVAVSQIAAGGDHEGTVAINLVWTCLNLLILGAALAVAWEARQRRSNMRVGIRLPVRLFLPNGTRVEGVTLDMSTGGASIQLDRPCELRTGDLARLFLPLGDSEFEMPIVVARVNGLRLGLHFSLASIAQHSVLTRVIFSRADAWIQWSEGRQKDRPLRSLGRLILIALRGIVMLPKGLLSGPGSDRTAPEATPRRAPALPLLGLLLGAIMLFPGRAAADQPFQDTLDLPSLGEKQPVTFRGREGHLSVNFGVPVTKLAHEVMLGLRFHSSGNYQTGSSVINVNLNGVTVASVPLQANSDSDAGSQVDVKLPPDLVVSDNTLTFQFSGVCRSGCRETVNWVRLETSTNVRIVGSMLTLANNLRLLPAPFFDSSLHRDVRIPMIFAESPDNPTLEAAGVVSSWLGILADDRNIQFPASTGPIQAGNAIVFTRNTSAIAAQLGLSDAAVPTLAIRDNPSDPYTKLLVVAGANGDQIRTAAQALALGQYPKQGDRADLSNFRLPPSPKPFEAPRWLDPSQTTGLGEKLSPDQLRVYGSGSVNFYFRLPPDLSFGQRYTVLLRLAYRISGLPADQKAEVRVKLNDAAVTSTRFTAPDGSTLRRENIYLPVSALYTNNTLTVDFKFNTDGTGKATTRYPEVSVLPSSFIDLRGIPRFVRLPRLDLFAQAGFPFTRVADLSEAAVILPAQATNEQIALYLNLLGRFGAQTGYPALRIAVAGPDQMQQARHKDLLVVGSRDRQPLVSNWADRMPLIVERDQLRPNRPSGLWTLISQIPFSPTGRELGRISDLLSSGETPEAIMEGFPSPLDNGRSAVVLTTGDQQSLQPLIGAFAGGANLADVNGSLSVLQGGKFHSFDLTQDSNYIGRLGWREIFNNWMANHFWLIAVAVCLCAVPLARWTHQWSDAKAQQRLQVSE